MTETNLKELENSVMNEITQTLDLPEADHDLNQTEKLNKDEKEIKADEEAKKQRITERQTKDITAKLKDANYPEEEISEYVKEITKRVEAGESLDDITDEIEALLKEEEEKDAEDEEEEKPEDDEADEDLIPKSKHDKVIKKMEQRIESLSSKIKEHESKMEKKDDSDKKKLESMSIDDLKSVKREARRALRRADDDTKADQLEDLIDEVDEHISTFPQRFRAKQVAALEKIVPDIVELHPDFVQQWKTQQGKLFETGRAIYGRSLSMQRSATGMAEAFNLACEYLKNQSASVEDKEKYKSLKKRVNNLKKKTSLSGRSLLTDAKRAKSSRIWKKAVEGDMDDKTRYIEEEMLSSINL